MNHEYHKTSNTSITVFCNKIQQRNYVLCTILNMLKLDERETLPILLTMIDHTSKPSSFCNTNIPYGQRLTSHEVQANGRSRISLKRGWPCFILQKRIFLHPPLPPPTQRNPRLLHWVLLTTSSVTTSTQFLRAIFFVSKLLMVMFKSSVTTSTCAFNEQFLLHLYRPQRSWGKVIFSEACVENSVHRGGGLCVAGGVWGMRGTCGRGMHGEGVHGRGACMAGGMHGRGHAWQGACVWQGGVHGKGDMCDKGVSMVGGVHGRGACMAKGVACMAYGQ